MDRLKYGVRTPGVYKIYFNDRSEFYIGSSVNLYQRRNEHSAMFKKNVHYNKRLQSAYNESGSYLMEILAYCYILEIKDIEQEHLDKNKDNLFMCNIALDSRSVGKGRPLSENNRKALRKYYDTHKDVLRAQWFANIDQRRKVIDITTGRVFESAKAVILEYNFVGPTFRGKINPKTIQSKNDTNFMYLDDYLTNKECTLEDFLKNRKAA